jgi:hypothetical protein
MSEVKQIVYKGEKIFLADHKGSQGNEVIRNQERMLEMIKNSGTTDALNITDMTGVYATPEVHQEMRRIGNDILKYSKKAAVVGMTKGAKYILINTFMRIASKPMKLFDNLEDAKEWLIKD